MSPECERLVGRKRIRKDVNRLTPEEKYQLNLALKFAIASAPNGLVFQDIANYHAAPYICPGEFVKNNNVKRQQEYANLIIFQIKLKDGN